MSSVCLSLEGCRRRQGRLRKGLQAEGLDGALITDLRHIHYLSGYWRAGRVLTPAALLVPLDGDTTLFAPAAPDAELAAEKVLEYEASRIGTLIDEPDAALFGVVRDRIRGISALGFEAFPAAWPLDVPHVRPIGAALRALRRAKDPDEVAMLERGIEGCDAAYARAKELLNEDVTEVQLYAAMLAAATEAVGEPLTEFGNDFQCGALGSLPRDRRVLPGEMAILDVAVVYRGYSSDLCRTFAVGGRPDEAQTAAHERVMEALRYVEETVGPGVSCRAVDTEVRAMLEGFRGWTFPHHLGHGIGLAAHEAPRLNPHWDDTFEVGDAFTAEPGLYGEALRAGIRIEHDYLITASGVERLSNFPTGLA